MTLWNDVLERILGCPRERALGRSLVMRCRSLRQDRLPRAINEALTNRSRADAGASSAAVAATARGFCRSKLLPVAGGVTLLWHDVTERTQRGTRPQAE